LRHEIHIAGHAFRLRPVADSDAAYIVDLRANAGPYVNRGAINVEQQQAWLDRYFTRADDFYFVVERLDRRTPEGIVGLYHVQSGQAEWGRFVLEPWSIAAVEAALLIYRLAFDVLSLDEVFCRTLEANAKVLAFHDSCGLVRLRGRITIEHDGRPATAVEHRLNRDGWPEVHERLDRLARRVARNLTAKDATRRR
jgi:RimJ/RimL family protein N-acetyltransferase